MRLNTITHFTKLDFFKKIILDKCFIPRYNKEDISHSLESDSSIESPSFSIPMICFCDSDIYANEHIMDYGGIGLGFTRKWAIEKTLIPVMYLHHKTKLVNNYYEIFSANAIEYSKATRKKRETFFKINENMVTIALYTKRYEGKFQRNGISRKKVFYREREWRYIPVNGEVLYSDLPEVINFRNNALIDDKSTHLKFDFVDIQAIYTVGDNYDALNSFIDQKNYPELKNKIQLID